MRLHWHVVTLAAIAAATCAFVPQRAIAQTRTDEKSDLLLRVGAPIDVGPADTIGTVWVIGNNVTLSGTVKDLVVIRGSAHITGTVKGNLVLMNGTADLGPSAVVGKDVLLYRSTVTSGSGAKILGTIHNEAGVSFGARALWLFWTSITLALIAIGLALGYFAKQPLATVADDMKSEWMGSILAMFAVLIVLPAAAVLSFMTGVGFVIGLFILFVLIPGLSLIGYMIAATAVGRTMIGAGRGDMTRMYAAVAVGVTLVQLAAVIPVIGGLGVVIGSQLGAGALVHHLWLKRHGDRPAHHLIIQPA